MAVDHLLLHAQELTRQATRRHDDGADVHHPLDMEVDQVPHTTDPQAETPWTSFRNPDFITEELTATSDGRVEFNITMSIEYRHLHETARSLAEVMAAYPGTDYDVTVTRTHNPIRIDNNPF